MNFYSPQEELAYHIAKYYHRNQKRKYTGKPYISHCIEIVTLLKEQKFYEIDMLCAAWLHDTLEDTDIPKDLISLIFGVDINFYVWELTNRSKPTDGNRAKRKQIDHSFLARACAVSQTIKLADIISNTSSIVERDPEFAKVYLAEMRLLLPLLTKGHSVLLNKAKSIIQ
jgi:(p)ppGpp synthase/HD superfamily hydrolase